MVSTPTTTPTLEDSISMPPQRTARSKKDKQAGESPASASWSDSDVNFLIDQVVSRRAEAGNGLNFKKAFWQSVASSPELANPTKGAPKTWSACKEKWSRLRKTFDSVHAVANASGFAYSPELGANIGAEGESVWVDYLLKNPAASSVKNKGWIFYEKMKLIGPTKGKGKNRFPPYTTSESTTAAGPSTITNAHGIQGGNAMSKSTSSLNTTSSGEGEPPGTSATVTSGAVTLRVGAASTTATTGSGMTMTAASTVNCPPPAAAAQPQSLSLFGGSSVVTPTTMTPPSLTHRTPSAFTPPTAPSSFTGSLASSVKPSSSISVRAGGSSGSGKRKANDDDVSMVSAATSRSAVGSAHSSTAARKRRSSGIKSRSTTELEDRLDVMNDAFHKHISVFGNAVDKISHPGNTRAAQPSTPGPSTSLEILKDQATNHLLSLEIGIFDTDQMGTILEKFRTDVSCVEMYLRLVANPSAEVIPIRRSWLTSLLK